MLRLCWNEVPRVRTMYWRFDADGEVRLCVALVGRARVDSSGERRWNRVSYRRADWSGPRGRGGRGVSRRTGRARCARTRVAERDSKLEPTGPE